ncbi:transcriptional coactivator p15/PC4 family protein [uncultured Ruegeria sp.]|uniref:transcriptional coactivator p15/PC4 family protein n=1 Tax=uncultured Ruegeria sp. TaxID=259304 RepID=UPI00260B4337|nr:transcriptional coactivator p15/PC4 family protein [uncultured Ruegeria sp.]
MTVTIQKNTQEEIRISREDFKGHDVVNLRVWYLAKDGEKHPTKKGVAFSAALLPDIQQALAEMAQEGGAL